MSSVYLGNPGPVVALTWGINTAEWSQKVSNICFLFTNSYNTSFSGGTKNIIFRPQSLPLTPLFSSQWHFIVRWDFCPEPLILASLEVT